MTVYDGMNKPITGGCNIKNLAEIYKENSINMLTAYTQQYIDDHGQHVWDQHLQEIEKMFSKNGDSAYGFFFLKVFKPLETEFLDAGFIPRPGLPGSFPESEEHWGPWENRERRFWSVIHQDNGNALGTLVTRIFHDHTRLHIPRPPQIYAIGETDPALISHIIRHTDPETASQDDGEDNDA